MPQKTFSAVFKMSKQAAPTNYSSSSPSPSHKLGKKAAQRRTHAPAPMGTAPQATQQLHSAAARPPAPRQHSPSLFRTWHMVGSKSAANLPLGHCFWTKWSWGRRCCHSACPGTTSKREAARPPAGGCRRRWCSQCARPLPCTAAGLVALHQGAVSGGQ